MAAPNVCHVCQTRQAELVCYPHYAAYNASQSDRPREPICGHCAAEMLDAKLAERVSPFAVVMIGLEAPL